VRKIESTFFIPLDGVVESPDKWHFPYFDEEMGAAVGASFATADAMLMGRVLYNEWGAYWPEHADEPFGDVMNSMKKYVISNTLHAPRWHDTELISGDVAAKLPTSRPRRITETCWQPAAFAAAETSPSADRSLAPRRPSCTARCVPRAASSLPDNLDVEIAGAERRPQPQPQQQMAF
jgi:hypothetical protein